MPSNFPSDRTIILMVLIILGTIGISIYQSGSKQTAALEAVVIEESPQIVWGRVDGGGFGHITIDLGPDGEAVGPLAVAKGVTPPESGKFVRAEIKTSGEKLFLLRWEEVPAWIVDGGAAYAASLEEEKATP